MRAHRDSGCGSSETTPTGTPSSSQERKSIGHSESEGVTSLPQPTRKKIQKLKKKVVPSNSVTPLSPILSPSLQSPPTLSPSLQSPPILSPLSVSPQILKKCRSVKVSLTKCDIERSSSGDDTLAIGTADKVAEISVGNEEDAALRSSQFYSVNRKSSTDIKKKEKGERERERLSDVKGIKDRAPATRRRHDRTSHQVPESTDILVTSDTIRLPSTAHKGRTPSQTASVGSNDVDMETLKSTLFGDSDSDSDCVILASSCSSGEEEIMSISFEDALRGVDLSRGRGGGRRPVGVVSKRKTEGKGGGRKGVKGKERVREKTGGGGKELEEGGSVEVVSDESSLNKVVKRKEGRRIPRDISDTAGKGGQRKSSLDQKRPNRRASGSKDISSQLPHPANGSRSKAKSDRKLSKNDGDVGSSGFPGNNPDDLAFKPDSRSLVNLSAVAKSNQLTSTSVKGQRSHQAPPPSSPAPISKPTYTIFKKKEVNVTGTVYLSVT